MKHTIRTVIKNWSKYSRDLVWKNALDLEHVTVLHPHTNAEFHLLGAFPEGSEAYETMVYRSKRRWFFLRINTFGFRKVVSSYQLWQMEYLPIFGMIMDVN